MKPKAIWTYPHPTTVSGVAVNGNYCATSCFDGNARRFEANGQLLLTTDVSPGTLNQDRQCIAWRLGILTCGENPMYAVAIRDDGTVCTQADVPTSRTVRGISLRGRFAVADDLICYNLVTGARWKFATADDWMFPPPDCAEDGETVWTVGPDKWVRHFSGDGQLLSQFNVGGFNPPFTIDVNDSKIIVTTWDCDLKVYDKAGKLLVCASESSLVHQAKFREDGKIVYGAADGRLVCWDGVSLEAASVIPAPTSPIKPKGRK